MVTLYKYINQSRSNSSTLYRPQPSTNCDMSTADFLFAQIAGENDCDQLLFDPNYRFLASSPQLYVHNNDFLNQAVPVIGFSGSNGVPFPDRLGGTEEDVFSSNTRYQFPDPAIDTASSTSNVDSQTPPSSVLSSEGILNGPEKVNQKPRKKTATTKQNPTSGELANVAPKIIRLPKGEATKTNNNLTKDPNETKTKYGRETSLERNRVAASNFRRRKKQRTNHLEQSRSELEAVHTNLQADYMGLLQESSQLKNLLLSHASCQDVDIGVWIRNEASKYVRNLHSPHPHPVNSLCSVLSLDGKCVSVPKQKRQYALPTGDLQQYVANNNMLEHGSTSQQPSPTTSRVIGTQKSPDQESQGLNSDDFPDEEDAFEGDLEN